MGRRYAQSIGAQVRKGAKAELAFYVGTTTKTVERNGEEQDQTIPFLKAYSVFNCDEIDNLPPHFAAPVVQAVLADDERMPTVDTFIAMTGATVLHGGGRAFYRPSADEIRLPEFGSFDSASAYYGTALHELAHWSGAEKRLDRTKGKLFGDPDYAFEELVAELGAAFLCADLGVSSEPREDHASYLAGWLKALKADERAIFRAASFAEKAATFLHGFQVQDQVAA
jgi:antirestriction protein ArdC